MLIIDNLPAHKPYIEQLIRKKFSKYERLVIKKEFTEGLSGSDVFMVRTIKATGAEIPSVIKVGRWAQIDREWKAYNSVIHRCLPGGTAIDGQPIYTEDEKYGLLWYPLAGQGSYEVASLLDYLRHSNLENIHSALSSRLFKNLNNLWKSSRKVHHEFSFSTSYDSFLPPNVTVEINGVHPASKKILSLHEENFGTFDETTIGKWIKIEGFEIVEVKYDNNTLVLNRGEGERPFKIHAQFVQDSNLARFESEKLFPSQAGKIIETRLGTIKKQIETALGSVFDTSSATILLPNQKYPNPLFNWQRILKQSFDVYVGPIHGDLNLNNILIEKDSGVVHLIDFSHSRQDHVLRDFFHLEMALVGTLLAETIWKNQLSPSWVCQFYEGLHQAIAGDEKEISIQGFEKTLSVFKIIRHEAKEHLFEPGNWSEYYCGLFLCFLGALKFPRFGDEQLGNLPKQTLVWGMAALLRLIEQSSKAKHLSKSSQTTRNEDASPYPIVSDNLVEGDENIIGDGNQVNAVQEPEPPQEKIQKKSNFERNVVKGNKNIIGSGNQVNRKK